MALFVVLAMLLAQLTFSASIVLDSDYDHNVNSNRAENKREPQSIGIQIQLQDIFDISQSGTLHWRLHISEVWEDSRIHIVDGDIVERVQIQQQIWEPSGTFKHVEEYSAVQVLLYYLQNNRENIHQVTRITRISVNLGWNFDYTWLPWDWQKWEFIYWDNFNPVMIAEYDLLAFDVEDDIQIAEWTIIDDYYSNDEEKNQFGDLAASAVKATIVFQRENAYFMRLAIIPAMFLVLISYASFFIDAKVIPARTILGVIPILTSFTLLGTTMLNLPRFSYVSWMTEFLFAHVIFNVLAMLEFALIAYIQRRTELKQSEQQTKHRKVPTTEQDIWISEPSTPDDLVQSNSGQNGNERIAQFGDSQSVNSETPAKRRSALRRSSTVSRVIENVFETLITTNPMKIDYWTRVIFPIVYLITLLIFFCLPIMNQYEEQLSNFDIKMEEADSFFVISLQQVNINVSEINDFLDPDTFLISVGQGLNFIDKTNNFSPDLPQATSGRYRLCTAYKDVLTNMGYKGQLTFNAFLFPNLRDIRSILSFILGYVPQEEEVEERMENPLLRKIKNKMTAWKSEMWTPFMEKTPKLKFTIQSVERPEGLTPELEELWLKYKQTAQFSANPASIIHGNQFEAAKGSLREIKLSRSVTKPENKVYFDASLPSLSEVLVKDELDLTETGGTFFHEALFAHETKTEEMKQEEEEEIEVQKNKEEQLEEQRESELDALRAQLEQLNIACGGLEVEVAAISKQHMTLEEEVEEYRKKTANLKKEGETKYKNAQLLPEADQNVSKLKVEIDETQRELDTMKTEFLDYKTQRQNEYDEKTSQQKAKRDEYQVKVKEVQQMKEDMNNIVTELQYKEDLYDYLADEDLKAGSSISRAVYIKRITDVIDKLKRQKREISRILKDVRDIESSIVLTREQFERIDNQAEELVFNEAKKDQWAKSCYEQLNKIREAYQNLVNTVEEQCSIKNAIRDVEIRYNTAQARNFAATLKQLSEDLNKIRAENQALMTQASN